MIESISLVCVGNICRSPMAAVILAASLDDRYSISSAGIGALVGEPADPTAVALMAERSLDLTGHVARQLDDSLISSSDLIMVMETRQAEWIEGNWPQSRGRVFRLGHWGGFEIPDPYRRGEATFRDALSLIDQGVVHWEEKLRRLA